MITRPATLITRPATLSAPGPPPPAPAPAPPPTAESEQRLDEVRRQVRRLLEQSPGFRGLPPDRQREIARHTVDVCNYLAAPEGIPGSRIASAQATARARALDRFGGAGGGAEEGVFRAQAAREGAAAAGALLQNVNVPDFVSQLIQGVFHSIVQSSIEQMEAYGRLVQSVAMTLNQFRDENVSANQGRDHLVEQFPDLFRLDIDTGEDGEQPRVRLRDGVDEDAALARVSSLPIEGGPVESLDDESIEATLVPAARTQLATSRQQLLATMVLMGINRIIVTDGRIAAKVMFDFQARDNMKWARSATRFDYDKDRMKTTSEGEYESERQASERQTTWTKEGGYSEDRRDGGYYAKGKYRSVSEPVLTLASATQATTDAALQTRASLSGQVEVNFKSETFPLEKMADSFQIGRIQDAARPGQVKASGGAGAGQSGPAAGATPASAGGTAAASSPAPAAAQNPAPR
jgi:hypothetical protein